MTELSLKGHDRNPPGVSDRVPRPNTSPVPNPSPLASVILLGCPKNQVDAEHVLGSLNDAGYRITTDVAASDVVVITTCAFLSSAVRESEGVIARTLELKKQHPAMRVVVAGCLVERQGAAALKKRFPDLALILPLVELPSLPRLLSGSSFRHSSLDIGHSRVGPRVLSTPPHLAYLRIADGCKNHCAYCLIPDIRGPLRSRTIPDVMREARSLARAGVKELVIIAQDTTLYGTDIYARPMLAALLKRLATVPGVRWLRLMYTHPAHLTEDVLDQFATNPKLCRYIDLPLQHVSDRILERMRRPYRRADIDLVLEQLRAIPDMHIRTTMIVGFPGETAAEFEELITFVRAARLDRLSAYAYSPEPGTPAFGLRPRVSAEVKRRRVRRLMLTQAAVSRANLRRLIGRELDVLVDEPGTGRTEWDAPEVDGTVRITGAKPAPGSMVRAVVTGASTHDLIARVLPRRPQRID